MTIRRLPAVAILIALTAHSAFAQAYSTVKQRVARHEAMLSGQRPVEADVDVDGGIEADTFQFQIEKPGSDEANPFE